MINRKAVALFVVLAAVPALAAWSQYPRAVSASADTEIVRTELVTSPTYEVTETAPVVVLVPKATRKATRVTTNSASFPKRGWHQMDQGPVSRQVRDL